MTNTRDSDSEAEFQFPLDSTTSISINFIIYENFKAESALATNWRKLQAAQRQLRIYNRAIDLIARSKARLEFRIQWLKEIREDLVTHL